MGQVWYIGYIGQQKPFKLPFQRKKLKPAEGVCNKCRASQGIRLAAFRNQNILLNLSFLGAVWHGTCVIVSVLFRHPPPQLFLSDLSIISNQNRVSASGFLCDLRPTDWCFQGYGIHFVWSQDSLLYYKQWVQRIVKYIVATNYSQVLRSNRKQGIELWLSNEHSTMYLALSFLLPSWLYLYYASVIRKFTCEINKWWF